MITTPNRISPSVADLGPGILACLLLFFLYIPFSLK